MSRDSTDVRFEIPPCPVSEMVALERELGIGHVLAQVLVRRGLADPARAKAWLAAEDEHPVTAFEGIQAAVDLVLDHVRAGDLMTVHGDYDVDGVCSTAILVRAVRAIGGRVDWYLPSRLEDGYGLSRPTVDRLAERGTRLLITADCAITAVDEVAYARARGLDVLVTDHHALRADGLLPDAAIVHPSVCGYPCPDLCATGVAYKLAGALHAGAGGDPSAADVDLDLVALATVADVVALRGENRRLVRTGLRALAATGRPGLKALMRVAELDPGSVDARAVGFRLAPRINAAGRLYRADAGLELLLTADEQRAASIAEELDRANGERRHTETRILFEAEAQVAQAGPQPAYVLAGEGWHPGVIGIVASRIAERHHRPAVLIALPEAARGPDPPRGTGSGRSIAGFDLLEGLRAGATHLRRFGGHRAAAGLEIEAPEIEAFRARFLAHAADVLGPHELTPVERVDAIVSGDDLGVTLAEELERLAPFGAGNPAVSLLVPAAGLEDARAMGEGKHVRFTVRAGGVRSRAVGFGTGGRLPVAGDEPVDATFALELNEWQGAVEPRLVLRQARACRPPAIACREERTPFLEAVWAAFEAPLPQTTPPRESSTGRRTLRDRRGRGIAGSLRSVVASGEPVLVVCADARRRLHHLAPRLGGFALCSYAALEADPDLTGGYRHLVALDPPALAHLEELVSAGAPDHYTHRIWGEPELRFAQSVHEHEYGLRPSLAALYRALRDTGGAEREGLAALLRGERDSPCSPELGGRLLRVLEELELVHVDRAAERVSVPLARSTELERSAAYRAYTRCLQEGRQYLRSATARAA